MITKSSYMQFLRCTCEPWDEGFMFHIGLVYRVTDWSGELISEMDEEDSLGAEWFKLDDLSEDQLSPFASKMVAGSSK